MTLDAHWAALVTAAILGTDRRDPPEPPAGDLADLAADDHRHDPAGRLLQQGAAATVARRAGLGVDARHCASDDDRGPVDDRPVTPPSATYTWRAVVADWPVLEDEWLQAVVATGHRLAPDLVVEVLRRHRSDPVRHARALVAAGALGGWMLARSPRLRAVSTRPVMPEDIASLPELAITPDLAPLLARGADEPLAPSGAPLLARAETLLLGPLRDGRFGPAHRPVLVHALARVHPALLPHLDPRLVAIADDPASSPTGQLLALSLLDLVRRRATMLTELESHR
jgi:hypothetical protein